MLVIHLRIGYTSLEHLLPLYVLGAATVTALALSKAYLSARSPRPRQQASIPQSRR